MGLAMFLILACAIIFVAAALVCWAEPLGPEVQGGLFVLLAGGAIFGLAVTWLLH